MTAYRPPGGLAAPEQLGAAAGQQPPASAAEQDPFADFFRPLSGESTGSPEYFGTTPAGQGSASAEPLDLLTARPPRSGRKAGVAALAAVAVLAAGGGVAFWLTGRHHAGSRASLGQATPSHTESRAVNGSSSSVLSPTPTATPTPTPTPTQTSSGNLVTAGLAVTQEPGTPRVEAFLNSYFTAINNHNYRQYRALLDQELRQAESTHDFYSGYGSTTDSGITLTGISNISPGRVGAAVTFTSHQLPSDSPSNSACTDWSITLFLTQHGSSYLLGSTPPGYHAAYRAC